METTEVGAFSDLSITKTDPVISLLHRSNDGKLLGYANAGDQNSTGY
jgi:hypothetical protein